jgi:hypothetical protein
MNLALRRSRDCDVQQLSPSHANSLPFCTSQGSKQMAGSRYGICGAGFRSMLIWSSEKDGTMLRIHHPQDLR